ncbi:MAG: DUF1772 domain-containing protein [Thermoanaerobaculia bacterium]|nr:DUF1772 domain-containing protein [Thermoanaerobaculia bacterium]
MNRSIESVLRFVNLTSAGLLAGSLGFGDSALTPGAENERPNDYPGEEESESFAPYFRAIGPIALVSAMALAVGAGNRGRGGKLLDTVSAIGQAGVLATTTFLTVPLNKKFETLAPVDYPRSVSHQQLARTFNRAHATRTALGIAAFVCAVASSALRKTHSQQ